MTKSIKPIRTDANLKAALDEINRLWGSKPGTPDGDRFEVLGVLVEDYEKRNYPIDPPTAIEAIEFRMEQMGLDRKALEKMIGPRARVKEILAGKRPLTLTMMRRLNEGLGIPFETLARQSFKNEPDKGCEIEKIGKAAKMGKARDVQERMHTPAKKQAAGKAPKRARRTNSNGQVVVVDPAHRTHKRNSLPGRAKP